LSRRSFIKAGAIGAAALTLPGTKLSARSPKYEGVETAEEVQGFDDSGYQDLHYGWKPVSDRKIKVGLIGYGLCKFSAEFGFQNHPNVEVVAVSDLVPERCAALAIAARCDRKYPSLEELVKDPEVEAVYIATDAPHHFEHVMLALDHGKHVACAVPAVFGNIEQAQLLLDKVKSTGLTYMMFETSVFRQDVYGARMLYKNGALGKITHCEGEYYHYSPTPIDSFQGWRTGVPPMWYPTHPTGYYIGATDGYFTEVSCLGVKSAIAEFNKKNNKYNNDFGTEVALFRTFEGGTARMIVSYDTPGFCGETGNYRGEFGTYYWEYETEGGWGKDISGINQMRPPIPDSVPRGGHGGSHGSLTDEFITSILLGRKPIVDIATALNMTVCGIVAHQSALKGGELMKVPHFEL